MVLSFFRRERQAVPAGGQHVTAAAGLAWCRPLWALTTAWVPGCPAQPLWHPASPDAGPSCPPRAGRYQQLLCRPFLRALVRADRPAWGLGARCRRPAAPLGRRVRLQPQDRGGGSLLPHLPAPQVPSPSPRDMAWAGPLHPGCGARVMLSAAQVQCLAWGWGWGSVQSWALFHFVLDTGRT